MGSGEQLTSLLSVLLIVSILILFVLVVAFVIITLKKKMKEKEDKPKKVEVVKTEESSKNVVQAKSYTTQDIKSFLDFDEIKDNMIIQNKGKRMVMVIQCQGINYDLMSSIEKVSVEKGFVQFLNTLTRPIQLYIQSRKVNLEDSIQKYNKRLTDVESKYYKAKLQYEQAQRNENLSKDRLDMIKLEFVRQKNLYEYTKDIISNTEKMSLNKNILTKNYYIAISYMPEDTENLFGKEELIDMAFSELYTNAQSLMRILSVCGVTGKVLDSVELADLLYTSYNRDAAEVYGIDKAIKAGYDSLYITAPDVIEKKMQTLDKMIEEKALELANGTIEEVTMKSKKRKELEDREKNIDELIKKMAKSMIEENEDYIGKEIAQESIEEIEKKVVTKEKKTRAKKGA